MNFKIKGKIIPFIFSLVILSLFIISMWDDAIQYSNDLMAQISVYLDASSWLFNNLQNEEKLQNAIKTIQKSFDVFKSQLNPTIEGD